MAKKRRALLGSKERREQKKKPALKLGAGLDSIGFCLDVMHALYNNAFFFVKKRKNTTAIDLRKTLRKTAFF